MPEKRFTVNRAKFFCISCISLHQLDEYGSEGLAKKSVSCTTTEPSRLIYGIVFCHAFVHLHVSEFPADAAHGSVLLDTQCRTSRGRDALRGHITGLGSLCTR